MISGNAPVSIVAAMTEDRVIGKDGGIPWNVSEDLRFFKKLTTGHPVIMGRRTFESIGTPLPGRVNIVLSRSVNRNTRDDVFVVPSLKDALEKAKSWMPGKEMFIIGGAEVFRLALPLADRIYLSIIPGSYPGDTYFPGIDPVAWLLRREEPRKGFLLKMFEKAV